MSKKNDIQELCEQVLNTKAYFYTDDNSPFTMVCPLCNVEIHQAGRPSATMKTIEHEPDCAYLIAKRLTYKEGYGKCPDCIWDGKPCGV